jgi:hypothetical protein
METKQSQIKINLPLKLKKKLEKRAWEYDMTLAGYAKYLIMDDIRRGQVPVMKPSKETIEAYKKAKKEEREGKLKEIRNIDDFFDMINK